jgi:hypothetical protein
MLAAGCRGKGFSAWLRWRGYRGRNVCFYLAIILAYAWCYPKGMAACVGKAEEGTDRALAWAFACGAFGLKAESLYLCWPKEK